MKGASILLGGAGVLCGGAWLLSSQSLSYHDVSLVKSVSQVLNTDYLSSWTVSQEDDNTDFQISTYNQTFSDFLARYPQDDLIWLTLADQFFSQTCTVHLQQFVKGLPSYVSPLDHRTRKQRLVTLCIDPGCMQTCRERNWTCYGEYELTRPKVIFPSTWPKLAGLIDILETGRDAVFVDSDVFFRSDPFEHMAPLGEHDWQIQDEAIEGNVNTGFFHIMSTENTIAHWKGVLAMDMAEVSRDQHNTNTLLGATNLRPAIEGVEGPSFAANFTSKNGIDVKVIPTQTVYSYHLSFSWPRLHAADAVAWHGTCLDNPAYKYLLPREHGFWQDIDSYYSSPPDLLRLEAISGTQSQIVEHMQQFISIAMRTNRTMIPPAMVTVESDKGELSVRPFASVFPINDLVLERALPLVESAYVEHALPYHISDAGMVESLLSENSFNVGAYGGVGQIADVLRTIEWVEKRVVTLSNWQQGHLVGEFLENLADLRTCARLTEAITCAQVCPSEESSQ